VTINGVTIKPEHLFSRNELIDYLRENSASDRDLAKIREAYQNEFGNELVWRYPISEELHLGTFIIPVKEGFLSLPFNAVDPEDYELLEINDARMLDEDSLELFINDWNRFSDDLLSAMTDMLVILRRARSHQPMWVQKLLSMPFRATT
jgi:hypothetical protein